MTKALELFRESLSGNQTIEEEIIPGVGISLRTAKDAGIQALYNITRDNNKLKLWTRHVKNLSLRYLLIEESSCILIENSCASVNDQHLLLLRDSLGSLNTLTALDINFEG